ncbi:MAG: topoisomerase DNA-binding C4 zinc finger domain-containing protein, partial [Deltaproteobacteria bacterium]|nr:topoisomerase DNA-binding C4 zinc finger domain-containing protein [Deltaproteobacteria bacterium]
KALEKHCPEIISVELTKKFDEEMDQIEEGKLKMEKVIKGAENHLKRILIDFKSHEKEIGTHIKEAVREYERIIHTVGTCNKCKKGDLKIIHSRRTGKRFVGCTNYPKCHNSFPLPQHGYVEVISRKCKCGLGLIQVRAKGRRPWRFCLVDKFEYYDKKGKGKTASKTVKKTTKSSAAKKTIPKAQAKNAKK